MTTPPKSISNRLRRHAATAAAWGLVLLAMGVAGLWADRDHADSMTFAWLNRELSASRLVAVTSESGAIDLRVARLTPPIVLPQTWFFTRTERSEDAWIWPPLVPYRRTITLGPFGFWSGSYANARTGAAASEHTLTVPHWFVLLLLLLWPAKRGMGYLKLHHRQRMGLCPNCGYDLRESPERCPECGTARASETRNPNLE